MRNKTSRSASAALLLLVLIFGINSCSIPEIHLRGSLQPIRKLFNKERSYWTDRMALKGETGTELVYYKNGRLALQRFFNEAGLLETVTYLGRNSEPLRLDSLVYTDGNLIAGYYFSEPGHKLVMRFLSYKRQGQLSQRSWFGSSGELLSREFFLFDRQGHRRSRMIFDDQDSLLYSETYNPELDQLDIQNTYSIQGDLLSQIRHEADQPSFRYDFGLPGQVSRISQLDPDGTVIWTSDLLYAKNGTLERSNFSTNGRFLFTYLGDLEFFRQATQTWRHPAQPGTTGLIFKMGHQDPFIVEKSRDSLGYQVLEYRLPESGALFKRSIHNELDQPMTDTLYAGHGQVLPVSVVTYDPTGLINNEVTYDLAGKPKWLHTWFRDDDSRVIREELTALPDTFSAAVTRFYDPFGQPAISER
ncbi:MAG: hypothetical protein L3J79_07145, partial [Candidatus Marinimicrobia bacterium]|nr:hypothetical protein [Candidatus Neomarinimicrobiota bacterium]